MAPGRRRKHLKKPAKPTRPAKKKREPRRSPPEPGVFIPPGFAVAAPAIIDPVNDDGDVYIPPMFGQPAEEDALDVPDSQGGTREWLHRLEEEYGTTGRLPFFFDPPPDKPLDVAVLREYVEELERGGFDERGRCKWKCGGAMSVIGRVRPPVALHNYKCPYWETPEGKLVAPF